MSEVQFEEGGWTEVKPAKRQAPAAKPANAHRFPARANRKPRENSEEGSPAALKERRPRKPQAESHDATTRKTTPPKKVVEEAAEITEKLAAPVEVEAALETARSVIPTPVKFEGMSKSWAHIARGGRVAASPASTVAETPKKTDEPKAVSRKASEVVPDTPEAPEAQSTVEQKESTASGPTEESSVASQSEGLVTAAVHPIEAAAPATPCAVEQPCVQEEVAPITEEAVVAPEPQQAPIYMPVDYAPAPMPEMDVRLPYHVQNVMRPDMYWTRQQIMQQQMLQHQMESTVQHYYTTYFNQFPEQLNRQWIPHMSHFYPIMPGFQLNESQEYFIRYHETRITKDRNPEEEAKLQAVLTRPAAMSSAMYCPPMPMQFPATKPWPFAPHHKQHRYPCGQPQQRNSRMQQRQ